MSPQKAWDLYVPAKALVTCPSALRAQHCHGWCSTMYRGPTKTFISFSGHRNDWEHWPASSPLVHAPVRARVCASASILTVQASLPLLSDSRFTAQWSGVGSSSVSGHRADLINTMDLVDACSPARPEPWYPNILLHVNKFNLTSQV